MVSAPRGTVGAWRAASAELDPLGERGLGSSLTVTVAYLPGTVLQLSLVGAGLPGIATNVLGDRLQLLQAGLIRRITLPPPAASTVYELTDRGRQLKPVLLALARWGLPLLSSPRAQDTYRLSWLVLALEERFDPPAAEGVDLTWELRVDDDVLHVKVGNGAVQTLQGPAPVPDVVLAADRDTFLAWGSGQLDDEQALAAGLRVTPGPEALQQLRRLFPNRLPAEAEP